MPYRPARWSEARLARAVVRELAGAEAIMRRDEINAADRNAQVTDPVRLATVH
jgi:hypothetical protein